MLEPVLSLLRKNATHPSDVYAFVGRVKKYVRVYMDGYIPDKLNDLDSRKRKQIFSPEQMSAYWTRHLFALIPKVVAGMVSEEDWSKACHFTREANFGDKDGQLHCQPGISRYDLSFYLTRWLFRIRITISFVESVLLRMNMFYLMDYINESGGNFMSHFD